MKKLWRERDSNPRPSAYEANVLTNCTTPPCMAGITHCPRRPRRKLIAAYRLRAASFPQRNPLPVFNLPMACRVAMSYCA